MLMGRSRKGTTSDYRREKGPSVELNSWGGEKVGGIQDPGVLRQEEGAFSLSV